RWKIGDGSKTEVMSELWIRGEDNFRLEAPQVQTNVAATIVTTTPLLEEVKEDQLV
ncbi:hypothetical protein L195_g005720, partial [Trifolium pratense]